MVFCVVELPPALEALNPILPPALKNALHSLSEDQLNVVSCSKLEPHRITTFLYELASLFHSYWNLGKDNSEKRFINDQKKITNEKLLFLKVISNVIKSGMDIVGVSTPEKM